MAGQTLKLETVQFPAVQVASSDPNALDDYEEGTWTPALALATSGSVTYNSTYTFAGSGSYTKVGRLVHVQCVIILSSMTSPVGAVTITGLPFASPAGASNYGAGVVVGNGLAAGITSPLVATIPPGGTAIAPMKHASGSFTALLGSDLTGGCEFYVSATYRV